MSAEGVDEEANGPLAFVLGNWSTMTSVEIVDNESVVEIDADTSLDWTNFVDYRTSLQSFVFPQLLLGFRVVYGFSIDCKTSCKFVNNMV